MTIDNEASKSDDNERMFCNIPPIKIKKDYSTLKVFSGFDSCLLWSPSEGTTWRNKIGHTRELTNTHGTDLSG